MSEITVKEKAIVVPGETLAQGIDFLPGEHTYREGEKIYAKALGMVNVAGRVIRITPLAGPYIPKIGDKIIGKVTDITMSAWRINTGTAYSALLNVRDASSRFIKREENLSNILAIGDSVLVNITNVTSQFLIDVTMREPGLHKLAGGRIISIDPLKVPRVIGKKGSMVTLIREKTKVDISVAQNGFIWLKGTPEMEFKHQMAILPKNRYNSVHCTKK